MRTWSSKSDQDAVRSPANCSKRADRVIAIEVDYLLVEHLRKKIRGQPSP